MLFIQFYIKNFSILIPWFAKDKERKNHIQHRVRFRRAKAYLLRFPTKRLQNFLVQEHKRQPTDEQECAKLR